MNAVHRSQLAVIPDQTETLESATQCTLRRRDFNSLHGRITTTISMWNLKINLKSKNYRTTKIYLRMPSRAEINNTRLLKIGISLRHANSTLSTPTSQSIRRTFRGTQERYSLRINPSVQLNWVTVVQQTTQKFFKILLSNSSFPDMKPARSRRTTTSSSRMAKYKQTFGKRKSRDAQTEER